MGSSCCKNALDKVRPPARPSSFESGEPPDPAAPWPGDTFCRAPPAQAPPVFPEGAFDSPRLLRGSFPSDTTTPQPQMAAAEDVPPRFGCLRRRSSMPAGSGGVAISHSLNQQQQQRILRASSSEPREVAGSRCVTAGPPHEGGTVNSSWRAVGDAQGNEGGDGLGAAAAGGTRRLPARLRQALRASRRRLTSRLRMGPGSKKQETGGEAGGSPGGGEAATLSTAPASSADAIFTKDVVDDTHFVRYPPSLSPSSECLNPVWPADAAPWAGPAPPRAAPGEMAAAVARGGGREGGDSSGQWTSGSGLASTAVSWTTPVSSSPSAVAGCREMRNGDITGEREETGRAVDATAAGGGGGAKKPFLGGVVAAPVLTKKKRSSSSSNSAKDHQRWLLKRSRGSGAASSFRAAVEGALPRWKGSRTPKERKGTARSRSSSGSGAEEGDWQKTKKSQEVCTSGEPKRVGCKGANNMRRVGVRGAGALRSSHCSSASTAAQEEDDFTTAGMEYWWTTSLPRQQEAEEEQLAAEVNSTEFQGALPTALPLFGGGSASQQPAAVTPVRQRQQQLAAPCDAPTPAGPPAAQAQTGAASLGGARAASAGTSLGRTHHQVEYMTDRLLQGPSPLTHDANSSSRNSASGNHFPVDADVAGGAEQIEQQPQQSLMSGPPASTFAGQDAHGYAGLHEYTDGARGSSGSSGARSARDVSHATGVTVNGSSRPGDEDAGGGGAWVEPETNAISALDAVVHETIAQQQHVARYRQEEIQNADKSGSSSDNHLPVVTMPFPE